MNIRKYLKEGSLKLRLMNYDSDLRKAQETIKGMITDVGDAISKEDISSGIQKFTDDLEKLNFDLSSIRGKLKQLIGAIK